MVLISKNVSAKLREVVVVVEVEVEEVEEVVVEVGVVVVLTEVVVEGETLTGRIPTGVRKKSRIEFLNRSRPIR